MRFIFGKCFDGKAIFFALMACFVFSSSGYADPAIGGNRIPDSYLTLKSHFSSAISDSVEVEYWDEDCASESCRVKGYISSNTRLIGGEATGVLQAFKKYQIRGIKCTGNACEDIISIEFAD